MKVQYLLHIGVCLLIMLASYLPLLLPTKFNGQLAGRSPGWIALSAMPDMQRFRVPPQATIVVDDKPASWREIQPNQHVTVTAHRRGDIWVATKVEAWSSASAMSRHSAGVLTCLCGNY